MVPTWKCCIARPAITSTIELSWGKALDVAPTASPLFATTAPDHGNNCFYLPPPPEVLGIKGRLSKHSERPGPRKLPLVGEEPSFVCLNSRPCCLTESRQSRAWPGHDAYCRLVHFVRALDLGHHGQRKPVPKGNAVQVFAYINMSTPQMTVLALEACSPRPYPGHTPRLQF